MSTSDAACWVRGSQLFALRSQYFSTHHKQHHTRRCQEGAEGPQKVLTSPHCDMPGNNKMSPTSTCNLSAHPRQSPAIHEACLMTNFMSWLRQWTETFWVKRLKTFLTSPDCTHTGPVSVLLWDNVNCTATVTDYRTQSWRQW